jgi:hypothetical protein
MESSWRIATAPLKRQETVVWGIASRGMMEAVEK